jgi:uncharacterized protein with PhoU and TrkA domain
MEIDMNTFTLIIRKGPYNERTAPTDWINETPIQTFAEVVRDVIDGQVDAEDIAKVMTIDLAAGTVTDVTGDVADLVWQDYDANNLHASKEVKAWLASFGHEVDHLTGETQDIRHFYGR